MSFRHPRILDSSALVALFHGNVELGAMMAQAEEGRWNLLLPATCVADAEHELQAGAGGWEPILLTGGVIPLELTVAAAVAVGGWPGSLSARHAVYEQRATRALVVTTDPAAYEGLRVSLLVV